MATNRAFLTSSSPLYLILYTHRVPILFMSKCDYHVVRRGPPLPMAEASRDDSKPLLKNVVQQLWQSWTQRHVLDLASRLTQLENMDIKKTSLYLKSAVYKNSQ